MAKYIKNFVGGNRSTKLRYISLWTIRILAFGVIIYAIVKGILDATKTNYSMYVNMGLQSIVLIVLTFVPVIVEKIWKVELPLTIVAIFLFLSLCSFFFGEIADFYIKYEWWDDFLHTFSGLYMAACSFFILQILNERKNVPYKSSPGFVIFFAFVTALACECVWEMIEYGVDFFFHTNMQRAYISQAFVENGAVNNIADPNFNALVGRAALNDTMGDIIEVVIGAMVACAVGFVSLKYDEKIKAFLNKRKKKNTCDENSLNELESPNDVSDENASSSNEK